MNETRREKSQYLRSSWCCEINLYRDGEIEGEREREREERDPHLSNVSQNLMIEGLSRCLLV